MTTALHLVPDPADEPTPPPEATGEQPPTAGPVVDLDELGDSTPPADADELDETGEDPDVDDEDDEDDEPAPARALALPDLRPYVSLDWIPQVVNAGVEGARRSRKRARRERAERREQRAPREPITRRLLTVAIDVAAGTLGMLRHAAAWLGGEGGPSSVKVQGRIGLALLAGYFCCRAVDTWPTYAVLALIAAWLGGALGTAHRARGEGEEKTPPKGRGKSVEKKPGPPPADTPDEPADDTPTEGPEQAPEEDPLTALIRAEIGGDNGVHLSDLRPAMRAALPHLSGASDERLREVLTEAGWDPSKKFRARGRAGRQGVHRNQLPPLPSPEGAPGHSPRAALQGGDRPRPANSSEAESGGERPGEGRRGAGERDYDVVPDPEWGPTAWRIVHHGKGNRSR
ncbi:hypothetical protein B0E38_07755 [Streptomyces sp. 111WW2]|nr:hypothetical protein B0E38_07755 [Streptomyces sp. 111WW2]